jgi:hypothetical protein
MLPEKKLQNINRLQTNLQFAIQLTKLFGKLDLPGNSDLDVIAVYIATQMYEGILDAENVAMMPPLVFQIVELMKEIKNPGK